VRQLHPLNTVRKEFHEAMQVPPLLTWCVCALVLKRPPGQGEFVASGDYGSALQHSQAALRAAECAPADTEC
jgi:hypothetical protein